MTGTKMSSRALVMVAALGLVACSFERDQRTICVEAVLSQPTTAAGIGGPINLDGRIESRDQVLYATTVELIAGECYTVEVLVMGSRPIPDVIVSSNHYD